MLNHLHVHDPHTARHALTHAHWTGAPQAPLLEGVRDGICNVSFYIHSAATLCQLNTKRPLIVIIGDDPPLDASEAVGPGGWRLCRKLIAWRPEAAVIHASGGEPEHYRRILAAAHCVDRVLLVETGSAQAGAWRALLTPVCPLVVILPATGVHPRSEMRH